jgi:hypothetical protein
MCHDFSEESLWFLTNHETQHAQQWKMHGVALNRKAPLLRDYIVIFTKENSLRQIDMSRSINKRHLVRFFRVYLSMLDKLKAQFIYARDTAIKIVALDIFPVLYMRGKYFTCLPHEPIINYCYLPLLLPPYNSSLNFISGIRQCALPDYLVKRDFGFDVLFQPLNNLTFSVSDRMIEFEGYFDTSLEILFSSLPVSSKFADFFVSSLKRMMFGDAVADQLPIFLDFYILAASALGLGFSMVSKKADISILSDLFHVLHAVHFLHEKYQKKIHFMSF